MKLFLAFLMIVALGLTTEINAQNPTDTINQKDSNNKKQGYWIKYYDDANTIIKEEGRYINNNKEGIWKQYFSDGVLQSEITFEQNKKNGYAKIYYENGVLSEEGIWKGNKWVGDYKFYHRNGKPQYQFAYSENGERTGKQKYFYESGALMIEGEWTNGKEAGVITEYHENGQVKSTKDFTDGKLDENSVKEYPINKEIVAEIKTEVKKEKVAEKIEPKAELKEYLTSLAQKYPEGITREVKEEENKTITRIIVVRAGIATEYKKIKYSFGQETYFKNESSISKSIFISETKE